MKCPGCGCELDSKNYCAMTLRCWPCHEAARPMPAPPPMIDGRGREVPLYRPSEPFAKLVPPPTVEYRKAPPGAALPIAGLAIGLVLIVIAIMSAHGC